MIDLRIYNQDGQREKWKRENCHNGTQTILKSKTEVTASKTFTTSHVGETPFFNIHRRHLPGRFDK